MSLADDGFAGGGAVFVIVVTGQSDDIPNAIQALAVDRFPSSVKNPGVNNHAARFIQHSAE